MQQVTTLTLFSFKTNKFWAFQQMGLAPFQLKDTEGLRFYKFLGTGGGQGFSLQPDFSTYAFLGVWESFSFYENCLQNHSIFKAYRNKATVQRDLVLKPIKSHGKWSGQNPFIPQTSTSNQTDIKKAVDRISEITGEADLEKSLQVLAGIVGKAARGKGKGEETPTAADIIAKAKEAGAELTEAEKKLVKEVARRVVEKVKKN